jgi:predicted enzyme related to lactoylglutathione lyase
MDYTAKYVHTNLVAKDWKKLASFYQTVFNCVPVPPERDLSGPAISSATSIPDAHIRGMHLRLPGYDQSGPTLEIFAYTPEMDHPAPVVNRPGYGHIAFLVDHVELAIKAVMENGGGMVGQCVTVKVGQGQVTFVYMTDPEGNILEIQSWA